MKTFLTFLVSICLLTVSFSQSDTETASPQLRKIQESILANPKSATIPVAPTGEPANQAKEILSNPLYRENVDTSKGESWLSDAIENLFRKIGDWLSNLFKGKEAPQVGGIGGGAAIIQGIVYLLIAILVGFLIFMLAQIRLKKKLIGNDEDSLVSDEEAKRSADQWIKEADRLAADGLFREAIRCLYLACLIRLDEQRVLRFERHETNWEHLHRFRDISNKPGAFDLQPATQKFDHAWYGLVPQDQSDVNWFKTEYQQLLDGLRQARA
ncbi:MAG: DUF4129 domain-containing protein [Fimbriimonadaceae bacterium]